MQIKRFLLILLLFILNSTIIAKRQNQKHVKNSTGLFKTSKYTENYKMRIKNNDTKNLNIDALREARIMRLLKMNAQLVLQNNKILNLDRNSKLISQKIEKKHMQDEENHQEVDDGNDTKTDIEDWETNPNYNRKRSWIVTFFIKYFRIIIFIALVVCHFIVVYPYFFGNFWVPFWQAKANSYQIMPMYRLAGREVSASEEELWDNVKIGETCREFELLYNEDYHIERLINIQFQEFLFYCKNKKSLEVEDISSTYSTLFIPLILTENPKRENKNPWYYFEVELTYLDPKLDFGIGFFEKPDKDNQTASEYVAHLEARREKNQTNKAKLGYYDNSIGFYLKSGSLMISGSNDYIFDIYEIYQKMHNPKRMFQANDSEVEENGLNDEEVYDFAGDTVGMAYNSQTGHVFITINGEIINKADPKVTTEINYKIMERHDKEDREFEHGEVMNKINKDINNYIKNLDLDKQYTDLMREVVEIKMTPGIEYIPAIMSGGETEFHLNIGRTAFRNVQPEFANGLLSPYDTSKTHAYMTRKPFTREQLETRKREKEYDGDSFQAESDMDSLNYENAQQ